MALLLQVVLGVGWFRSAVGGDRFFLVVTSYAIVGAWLVVNTTLQAPALRAPAGVITSGGLLILIPICSHRDAVSAVRSATASGDASRA